MTSSFSDFFTLLITRSRPLSSEMMCRSVIDPFPSSLLGPHECLSLVFLLLSPPFPVTREKFRKNHLIPGLDLPQVSSLFWTALLTNMPNTPFYGTTAPAICPNQMRLHGSSRLIHSRLESSPALFQHALLSAPPK